MDLATIEADAELKLKAIQQLCSTNPHLEIERRNLLQRTPDIEPLFRELMSATANIHIGWLLSAPGSLICRELSICLDSQNAGWEDLAFELGITPDVIRDIRFNRSLDEGPTVTVIWIYAYKADATIDKLLETLYRMKRYDVLLKLRDHVFGENGLIHLLQLDSEKQRQNGCISNNLSGNSIKAPQCELVRPKVPNLPNKYQVFSSPATVKLHNLSENTHERRLCNERLVTRDINTSVDDSAVVQRTTQKTSYRAIVMLTFALDGADCAKRVAAILRKERIGVLILDEHREHLISNPELFITGLFPQVNYIVPIVTKGYLEALSATSLPAAPLTSSPDARYAKLIYTLMNNQYLRNGCINLNVRCIIPDGSERIMQEHPGAYNRPVLQVWLSEHDVQVFTSAAVSSVEALMEK